MSFRLQTRSARNYLTPEQNVKYNEMKRACQFLTIQPVSNLIRVNILKKYWMSLLISTMQEINNLPTVEIQFKNNHFQTSLTDQKSVTMLGVKVTELSERCSVSLDTLVTV